MTAKRLLSGLLLLFLALLLLALWLLASETGSRLLLQALSPCRFAGMRGVLLGRLELEGVECSLGEAELQLGRLVSSWHGLRHRVALSRLAYRDSGQALLGEALALRWRPSRLLSGRVVIEEVSGKGIAYLPGEGGGEERTQLPPIALPLPLELQKLRLEEIGIGAGSDRFSIDWVELSGKMRGARLEIERLAGRLAGVELLATGWLLAREDYPLDLDLSWRATFAGEPFSGEGRLEGSLAELALHHRLREPFLVETAGTLSPLDQPLRFALSGAWKALTWPPASKAWRLEGGRYRIEGSPERYRLALKTTLKAAGLPVRLELLGSGSLEALDVGKLTARLPRGTLSASGRLAWSPSLRVAFTLKGEGLDPALFLPDWPGRLALKAELKAHLGEEGLRARLDLASLKGVLRELPFEASGHLTLSQARGRTTLRLDPLQVRQGEGRVAARGEVSLEAPSWRLELSGRGLSGALAAGLGQEALRELSGLSFELKTWGSPREATLQLRRLAFRWRKVPVKGGGVLRKRGETVAIERLRLRARSGQLSLSGQVAPSRIALEARLRLDRLSELAPDLKGGLALSLRAAGPPRAPELHLDLKGRGLAWRELTAGALDLKLSAAPDPFRLSLKLRQLQLGEQPVTRLALEASGRLRAHRVELELAREEGQLLWRGEGGVEQKRWRLEASELLLSLPRRPPLRLAGEDYRHRLELSPSGLVHRLDLLLSDLRPLNPWLPAISELHGRLALHLRQEGPFGALRTTLQASLSELTFVLPQAGIRLEGGRAVARGGDGGIELEGEIRSGGRVAFSGHWSKEKGFRLDLSGQDFQAVDLPKISAWISPDLRIEGREGISVSGRLDVPRAAIRLEDPFTARGLLAQAGQLIGGKGEASGEVVPLSEDEVLVGEEKRRSPRLSLSVDLQVSLGREVTFRGYGLDARLSGLLTLKQKERPPLLAFGTVRLVDATFTLYGQELKVDRGLLLFSGPLDRPRIDVVATRPLHGRIQSVSLKVQGQLPSPRVVITSQPPLPQREALAYLLLGRPFSELARGERSALAQVGVRLGVSMLEEWLRQNGNSSGEKSVWKKLAGWLRGRILGDLTFDYRFRPSGGALHLSYRLFRWLTLEASVGQTRAADLLWTFEFDTP